MNEDKRTKGIYEKYRVTRTDHQDEPGLKHHGCRLFVLDMTHDPFARKAAMAYADACAEEYPVLASDLRGIVHLIETDK